jgi:hypothetical protein
MRIRPTEIDYGAGDDGAVDVEETQDGLKVNHCLVRRCDARRLTPCIGIFVVAYVRCREGRKQDAGLPESW